MERGPGLANNVMQYYSGKRMVVGVNFELGLYSSNQLCPSLSVLGKLVPLQLNFEGR